MRLSALLLLLCLPAIAHAQDAHLQQQRAAFAFREMQQAERDAERAQAEARDIEAETVRARKQLEQLEQRGAAARKQAAEAQGRAAEARTRWQTETEALEKIQGRPGQKP